MRNCWLVYCTFVLCLTSCSKSESCSNYLLAEKPGGSNETISLTPESVARIFAALPLESAHLNEVYDAVSNSSVNGYDEEYTMDRLFSSPGSGVGDKSTKALSNYSKPIRVLLEEYLSSKKTKSGEMSGEEMLKELELSGYQIYWPYSEDWDKEMLPIITFDPGYGSEYNYGLQLRYNQSGQIVADSVYVDESVALKRPVWVINKNTDADCKPLQLFTPQEYQYSSSVSSGTKAMSRILRLKSFTMLRHYDSWFQGASEFMIKCGSVNGFCASTEAELKLYSPSVTDLMIVVPRKYLKKKREYNTIIMTNFTNQLDNLAFLITEDDGGASTSWKCSATVKIKSKSYGFDVDIPYKENDDIVWRGQLSAWFFQSADLVTARLGEVELEFELE